MYTIQRDDNEIDNLLNDCAESETAGTSKFPGMTYEQGLRAGIDWITGTVKDHPLED
jgi:hypothetical protein